MHRPRGSNAPREYPGVDFIVAGARTFALAPPFDAIFSNAPLPWLGEPYRPLDALKRVSRMLERIPPR